MWNSRKSAWEIFMKICWKTLRVQPHRPIIKSSLHGLVSTYFSAFDKTSYKFCWNSVWEISNQNLSSNSDFGLYQSIIKYCSHTGNVINGLILVSKIRFTDTLGRIPLLILLNTFTSSVWPDVRLYSFILRLYCDIQQRWEEWEPE
jgi:hypothetical protein